MKNNLLRIFFLFAIYQSYGQIKIGNDVSSIDPSSILELDSDNRTLVLTQVTEAQMQQIFPLNGALTYNTNMRTVHYYDGSKWVDLGKSNTTSGRVLIDNGDGTFTFTSGNGEVTTFHGQAETVTQIIDNGDGTFTYFNESGTETILSLSAPISFDDLTDVPANLDVDTTDDFSGSFDDLTDIPVELADGDDDTQLTEIEVDTFVANNGYLTTEVDGSITNEIQQFTSADKSVDLKRTGNDYDLSLKHRTMALGKIDGSVIVNASGISGVTSSGTGTYTVNLSEAMNDANYILQVSVVESSASFTNIRVIDQQEDEFTVEIKNITVLSRGPSTVSKISAVWYFTIQEN